MDDLSLPPNQYQVEIRGTKIAIGEALPGHFFVIEAPSVLKRQGIDAIDALDPITNQPASWVTEDQIDYLQESSIPFQNLTLEY